jgi:hypothetical protein
MRKPARGSVHRCVLAGIQTRREIMASEDPKDAALLFSLALSSLISVAPSEEVRSLLREAWEHADRAAFPKPKAAKDETQ